MKSLKINLNNPVLMYYGISIQNEFFGLLKQYQYDRVFIICDADVYNLYGIPFTNTLSMNGVKYDVICVAAKEENKSFKQLEFICNKLVEFDITKDSIIIGFGGGLVCNLSGLVAHIIFRGIRYIEIPTTLMGQTDGSISNKQGINGNYGKNQFGAYHAPLFVWADIAYLKSERLEFVRGAIVEAIKNGLISDELFLKQLVPYLCKKHFSLNEFYDLFELIVNSKNNILKLDPSEESESIILEYGHTVGHAIEFLSNGEIIHGEAVAIGMCIMSEVSCKLHYLTKEDVELHYRLLLPMVRHKSLRNMKDLCVDDIMKVISKDNKKRKFGAGYILLERIGKCLDANGSYSINLNDDMVHECIEMFLKKECVKKCFL